MQLTRLTRPSLMPARTPAPPPPANYTLAQLAPALGSLTLAMGLVRVPQPAPAARLLCLPARAPAADGASRRSLGQRRMHASS